MGLVPLVLLLPPPPKDEVEDSDEDEADLFPILETDDEEAPPLPDVFFAVMGASVGSFFSPILFEEDTTMNSSWLIVAIVSALLGAVRISLRALPLVFLRAVCDEDDEEELEEGAGAIVT